MLKKFINNYAIGKIVLILFLLSNLVFIYMLQISIPNVMEYSNGMKILDLMPTGYSHDYIQNLFATLGKEGRELYKYGQIPFDMVYPGLSGICYSLMIGYFLKKMNKQNTSLLYLTLVPLVASLFDYIENLGIVLMLNSYPNLSKKLMSATNISSILKSSTSTLFYTTLIILIVIWLIRVIRLKL